MHRSNPGRLFHFLAPGTAAGQMNVVINRFGKQKWLQPYTDTLLRQLPGNGKKRLYVVCPAFSVDCLETLEEIAEEGKETYLHAGGEFFRYVPALNADPGYMETLAAFIRQWQCAIQY